MALSPAEGSLIFFVIYSVIITALLVIFLILWRKKKSRDNSNNIRNPPHQLPYHENKSFQGDNPVVFVSHATPNRPNNPNREQSFLPEVSTVEYEIQRRQRNISRGEESLASFKSVVDNYIEDFASVRSDSFHTLYDEVTLCSSSPKNGRLQGEKEFFDSISDNSHLKKKKIAPKPPSISKAKVLCIPSSDGFKYDSPNMSEDPVNLNQINQPFNPKNSVPLFTSPVAVVDVGILEKASPKRKSEALSELKPTLNSLKPDLISESSLHSNNKSNSSSVSSSLDTVDKKLNQRHDSDASERTIIVSNTVPKKIKIVNSESSDSDITSIDETEFVRLNFKSRDLSRSNNTSKSHYDEKVNFENKYEIVDGEFSITDDKIISSTLRDKNILIDSLDESIISSPHTDDNQKYHKIEIYDSKLKMCEPVCYTSSTDTEKDLSDMENASNITELNRDMSIVSEISTNSIHFQNFHEHNEGKKGSKISTNAQRTNNHNEMKANNDFSETEIKRCIPKALSSSSSSNSSSDSQKLDSYTKVTSSRDLHPLESLSNPNQIDTNYVPKINDSVPQISTNAQKTNDHINELKAKDDLSVTEIKQCIPRTLSSSSSSNFSSDAHKLDAYRKITSSYNVRQLESLANHIRIGTQSLPNINSRASQMSMKYVPISQIRKQMDASQIEANFTPDHSNFKLLKTIDTNTPDEKYSLNDMPNLKNKEHDNDYSSLGKSIIEEEESTDSTRLSSKFSKISEEKGDSINNKKYSEKIIVETESSSDSNDELPILQISPPNLRKKSFLVEWDKDITNDMMAPQVLREVSFVSESSKTSTSSDIDSEEDNERPTKQMTLCPAYQHIIPHTIQELSAEEYSDEHDGSVVSLQHSSDSKDTQIKQCVRVSSSSSSESEIIHSPPNPMQVLSRNEQVPIKRNLKRSKSLDSVSSLGSNKSNTILVNPIVDLFSSKSLFRNERAKSHDFDIKYPAYFSLNRNYRAVYEIQSMKEKKESIERSISIESL